MGSINDQTIIILAVKNEAEYIEMILNCSGMVFCESVFIVQDHIIFCPTQSSKNGCGIRGNYFKLSDKYHTIVPGCHYHMPDKGSMICGSIGVFLNKGEDTYALTVGHPFKDKCIGERLFHPPLENRESNSFPFGFLQKSRVEIVSNQNHKCWADLSLIKVLKDINSLHLNTVIHVANKVPLSFDDHITLNALDFEFDGTDEDLHYIITHSNIVLTEVLCFNPLYVWRHHDKPPTKEIAMKYKSSFTNVEGDSGNV